MSPLFSRAFSGRDRQLQQGALNTPPTPVCLVPSLQAEEGGYVRTVTVVPHSTALWLQHRVPIDGIPQGFGEEEHHQHIARNQFDVHAGNSTGVRLSEKNRPYDWTRWPLLSTLAVTFEHTVQA